MYGEIPLISFISEKVKKSVSSGRVVVTEEDKSVLVEALFSRLVFSSIVGRTIFSRIL